ncbi:unnamed protein product [Caenorhabditis angaria]|uniref:Uncharacterized protein n=1 Tax=Caenorhabditis angaria TaxID=860376 RepID=A0A9P1J3Q7_9PELO|nr:unnamed protein product [Caenorhabditis angaria]
MSRNYYGFLSIALIFTVVLFISVEARYKRQTYQYDPYLMSYAHPHPGTKVQQGYLARYAPQDWPKWYSRNMMKWTGHSRFSPYETNDVRYPSWHNDFVHRNV